ncbi:MAG: hypothetical protein ACLFQX_10650 [Candidatus Kapaibacterium sp.]
MNPALLKAGFIILAAAGFLLLNSDLRINFIKNSKKLFIRKEKDVNYVAPDEISFR